MYCIKSSDNLETFIKRDVAIKCRLEVAARIRERETRSRGSLVGWWIVVSAWQPAAVAPVESEVGKWTNGIVPNRSRRGTSISPLSRP